MFCRSIARRVFRREDFLLIHGRTLVPVGPGRATTNFSSRMNCQGLKPSLPNNLMSRLKPRPTNPLHPAPMKRPGDER
jgi:hypothetical protein